MAASCVSRGEGGGCEANTPTQLLLDQEFQVRSLFWVYRQATGTNGSLKRLVILFRLVGVGYRVLLQGVVETLARSQVPGNHDCTASLRMSTRQRPAAQGGVRYQRARPKRFHFRGDLHVAELTNVVIVPLRAAPAEEDVAGCLHQALAFHHPIPLVCVATLAPRRLQYRPARFLDLQEERIVVVQKEGNHAAGPHAAHTHDFHDCVLVAITLVQTSPIRLQRLLISFGELVALLVESANKVLDM